MTYRPTIRTEFTASPAALARISIQYPRPVPVYRTITEGPPQRLRDVAAANTKAAARLPKSDPNKARLEQQAAGLLAVARSAANDNGRKAVAA